MEVRDAFEDVIKGHPPSRSPGKSQTSPAKPQPIMSSGPPAAEEKETQSLGQKAAGFFNTIASKVGSFLGPSKEKPEDLKGSPTDSPNMWLKDQMFTIEDETASLKPNEQVSPQPRKKMAKGEALGKGLSLPLISCKKEVMFSLFSKIINVNRYILIEETMLYVIAEIDMRLKVKHAIEIKRLFKISYKMKDGKEMLLVLHFFNKDYNPAQLPVLKKYVFTIKEGKQLVDDLKSKCSSLFGKTVLVDEIK